MSDGARETWSFDLVGAGKIGAPDGSEETIGARIVWTMTDDHTIRFLIYLGDMATPIVRILSTEERHAVASATVDALQSFMRLAQTA